jgi:hypothetical protein
MFFYNNQTNFSSSMEYYNVPSTTNLPTARKLNVRSCPWCLTKYHAMKTYCRSGGIAPRVLNLRAKWRWVVSFTLRSLYLWKRAPSTLCVWSWVDPRASLDAATKRKVPLPYRESKSGRSARSLVTILTELPRVLTQTLVTFCRLIVTPVFLYVCEWCEITEG